MIYPELQVADLARVRAELAHALASNQADDALQPMAATRELYRSSPVPMRMSAASAPRAHGPRGFFAG